MRIKTEAFKNPKNIKVAVVIIILFIIGVSGAKSYKALLVKNQKLKEDIIKKTKEISKGADIPSLKLTINSEIKELGTKLSAIEARFSSNTEEVFSSLNRFIEASEISLKAISPLEKTESGIPNSNDKYFELPINLKVECNYFQLLSFLNKVENASKIMRVTDVKIQSNQDNIWEHNIEISLKVPIVFVSAKKLNDK